MKRTIKLDDFKDALKKAMDMSILEKIDEGLDYVKERVKKDPEYGKQLLIGAGIWDKEGNLTERYK